MDEDLEEEAEETKKENQGRGLEVAHRQEEVQDLDKVSGYIAVSYFADPPNWTIK